MSDMDIQNVQETSDFEETETVEAPHLPDILTVEELAEYLRVDRKTIYEMVARRELPGCVRVGRTIRISTKAVMTWFEGGERRRPARPVRRVS